MRPMTVMFTKSQNVNGQAHLGVHDCTRTRLNRGNGKLDIRQGIAITKGFRGTKTNEVILEHLHHRHCKITSILCNLTAPLLT